MTSEDLVSGQSIDIGCQDVHEEDRKRNTLGIDTEIADEECKESRADTEDQLTLCGCGRRYVIGRHEDCADHETARKDKGERLCGVKSFCEKGKEEKRMSIMKVVDMAGKEVSYLVGIDYDKMSAEEAKALLEKIRTILRYIEVSDCNQAL